MKPTPPVVTLIIVNYNTRQLTLDCLASVYEHTTDVSFEIVVVDNASQDDSAAAIQLAFPDVHLIRNPSNIGFGPANNVGIRSSSSPYVFLLNSDTILTSNAVKQLYDHMERPDQSDVACCGGQLLNPDGTPQASYGSFPSWMQVAFDQFELRRLFRSYYRRRLAVANDRPGSSMMAVPYISGADMFIRRSALDKAGLFDERFFLYFEETDLCFQFRSAGYRCIFVPEARIVHLVGQSSKDGALSRMRLFKQSELLFFEKNRGKLTRRLVKLLYAKGYALRWLLTWNRYYWDLLRITLTT